jgi:uncharacterized protein with GYD domain
VPYYMVQLSYTPEAVGNLVRNPQNRIEAVRPAFEELGVTIRDSYLAFGEYDVVLIAEAPGNVQAAAIAMAVTAGGGVSKYRTTPLMSWEEGVEAMQAAGGSGYQPPSR